jgi:transposase
MEGRREQPRVVGATLVVQVAHCRLYVGVAHPRLDLDNARDVDRQAAERMAQVVEAQRAQVGGGECAAVSPAQLTAQVAPALREAFGIGVDVAAEMLILAGDNPERIRSEAAFAKLCGACPIPASSGATHRHRLNWDGHRQANSALYRSVIVRMRFHPPTIAYVTRRTQEGKTKREIIRCLKRYLTREIYHTITHPPTPQPVPRKPTQNAS